MKNEELINLLQEQDPEEEIKVRVVFFRVVHPYEIKIFFRPATGLKKIEIEGKTFTCLDFEGHFEE